MNKINIAIDGYSSCGKSTIAKALASELGYKYVDSGAMYRAITLFAMREGFINDAGELIIQKLIENLDRIHLSFHYNSVTKKSDIYLNDEDVEEPIRMMDVSEQVSKVSQIKQVRKRMVALQKEMGMGKGIVMDGRDIGTAVFPNAELKIFMTADPEIRVYRRYDELTSKGVKVSKDEIKENLLQRDFDDTNRKENPLIKADDAIVLDNTDLNKQQQLDYVLRLVKDMQLIRE
ncbi:MAG: (d)CMP kinase [Bacteroidetes bacterium]|nr:(d)CMP kinase [Bacteroidota bacterium]